MKPATRYAMIAALLVSISACKTLPPDTRATASDTGHSSLCLVMRPIPLRPAPAVDAADPFNTFDTDATTEAVMESNARWRAACPSPSSGEGVGQRAP